MRHGRRRCEKRRTAPTLYAREFATADDHSNDSFSWDTDGIPFVIDNSVTAIIFSQRRLFTGPLVPTSETLEISEGLTPATKHFGTTKLILTDKNNNHHSYVIPHCVFDTNTPVNILGVTEIGTFFGDNTDAADPLV